MKLNNVQVTYVKGCSNLQKIRKNQKCDLPNVLLNPQSLSISYHEALGAVADHEDIEKAFPSTYGRARISLNCNANMSSSSSSSSSPVRIGVVLSGGQAAGGHNVIAGVYDCIKKISTDSELIGFLDGPHGLFSGNYCVINDEHMDNFRNSGGFNMIGSGRHKIEKPEQFISSMEVCDQLCLTGVIIIGGDDSNTNAAVLAEYFEANNCNTKICGVPKTIDGDLKVHPYIPISFGFDTACATYSELIGNLGQDTLSSQKYYHFVRLMGRAASNIALECALQTRPNICLISEEIEAKNMTLSQITHQIVDIILKRNEIGKDYGVILLPEGLIEFIPEFNVLISQINDILASGVETTEEAVVPHLSYNNRAVFSYLPSNIKLQLLLDRDPHGNVQVSQIETERLLAATVSMELETLRSEGKYHGKFEAQYHSFGYEGRSGLPSVFDSTYCYALGQNVAAMISLGLNGMISSITNLTAPVSEWVCGGVPITMMCHMEKRIGKKKPVIKKALVELDGKPFQCFVNQRDSWAIYDLYRSPGPIQFFDTKSLDLCITLTLELKNEDYRMDQEKLKYSIERQKTSTRFGNFLQYDRNDKSAAVLSHLEIKRSKYIPELCPSFIRNDPKKRDRDNNNVNDSYSKCIEQQSTQCKRSCDISQLSSIFPNTYGDKLVSIIASNSESDQTIQKINQNSHKCKNNLKIGIAFCGRQAPGGHDIIAGVFDSLPSNSTLYGFVGGSSGIVQNHSIEITKDILSTYRGQGGFEILCRSTDSISLKNYSKILVTCNELQLDGLVLVGGSRTCTDAAYLGEYLVTNNCKTCIVTTPVGTVCSLKNEFVESCVGFDTATKVTGQIVGNCSTDGASSKKYYYFMRLMGDAPSLSALEVALTTHPSYVILAEEVKAKNMTLADIIREISDVVCIRAKVGKNYGTVLIPEGLVDSIPELHLLNSELETILQEDNGNKSNTKLFFSHVLSKLTLWSKALLQSLPDYMQSALLSSRGSDKGIKMSQAETERLLAHFVDIELSYRKKKGTFDGKFAYLCSFIGYQARGALPSNFDVNFAYNLGFAATHLIKYGYNNYVATVNNLKHPVRKWTVSGVPISAMMTIDKNKAVIQKACVDLNGPSYKALLNNKNYSNTIDRYENPGPIQFEGPEELINSIPISLTLENFDYMIDIKKLQMAFSSIEQTCRPGCPNLFLQIATNTLTNLTNTLELCNNEIQTNTINVIKDLE